MPSAMTVRSLSGSLSATEFFDAARWKFAGQRVDDRGQIARAHKQPIEREPEIRVVAGLQQEVSLTSRQLSQHIVIHRSVSSLLSRFRPNPIQDMARRA